MAKLSKRLYLVGANSAAGRFLYYWSVLVLGGGHKSRCGDMEEWANWIDKTYGTSAQWQYKHPASRLAQKQDSVVWTLGLFQTMQSYHQLFDTYSPPPPLMYNPTIIPLLMNLNIMGVHRKKSGVQWLKRNKGDLVLQFKNIAWVIYLLTVNHFFQEGIGGGQVPPS